MNYLKMLQHSYETTVNSYPDGTEMDKLQFIGEHIFNFTTYENEILSLMTVKAIEVCQAISAKLTHEYMDSKDGYFWYLIMVNMPFFSNRIDWGTSIRGAWWIHGNQTLQNCGLFSNSEQLLKMEFSPKEWSEFIDAMAIFVSDVAQNFNGLQTSDEIISVKNVASTEEPATVTVRRPDGTVYTVESSDRINWTIMGAEK